jgi:ADP-ribose pyrophosphatase YjhB (NUDIX family)
MINKLKEKAGVVAYRIDDDGTPHVLVVSARKYPGSWVFPVGGVKKNETLRCAAQRECAEETGYRVELQRELAAVEAVDERKVIRYTFFLATIIGQNDIWETDRQRRWVPTARLPDMLPPIFHTVAREAVSLLNAP